MSGAAHFPAIKALRLFICALATSLLLGTSSFANADVHDKWVKGRILVQVKGGVSHDHLKKLLTPQNANADDSINGINTHIISVPLGAEDRIIKALSRHPFVVSAEKDMYVQVNEYTPNDPKFASAWHLQTMNVPGAWDITRGDGITVAVLDTGVNGAHEDLSGKMVAGRNVVSKNTDTADIHGHGTKVAGVIGAVMDNSLGVASIAPNAWIMPVRITNDTNGWASTSAIAAGITWAVDNGADVASISFESTDSSVVRNAADYMRSKGGMVVIAAGNAGNNLSTADSNSIISVSATTNSDGKASWSNYGNFIDVAAPGANIWTTTRSGGYASVSGTSFSTPATAATIALIMSVDPSLTPAEIETVLENSAVDLGAPGFDPEFGNGRVDALAAVLLAGGQTPPPTDTEPPTVAFSSPQNGATLSGIVPITATASDNTGVTRVELFDDAGLVGTVLTAPYNFSWDSARTGEGSTTTLRLVAYDSKGNTGNQSIIVNVTDTTPPVISAPGNKIVEATGALTSVALGNASATDNVDSTVSVTPDKTGPFPLGNNVITWTASDSSNNTATAKQTITVRDTTPPAVTAPANKTVVASGTLTTVALGSASAIDLIDGTLLAVASPAGPFKVGVTVVTWQASDNQGNTGTATQTVTVTQPDTPPQVNAPANKTVEATGKLTAVNIGSATASDNEDGNLTAIPDNTGPFPLGNNVITWTATDSEGNTATAKQTITVRDTTPPAVTAPANKAVVASGTLTTVALGSASATDLVDGTLLAVASPAGPFEVGVTVVTWQASDDQGNTGTATQTVTVTQADSTPPQVNAPPGKTVEATGKLTAVNIGTATASDNEDGNLTAIPDNTGPFPLGNNVVTWTATDSKGNTATAKQTITVRDTTPPAVTAPAKKSVTASGTLTNVTLGSATAIDLVDGSLLAVASPAGPFEVGVTVVTWQASDNQGNTGTATQTVTVTQADSTPPQVNAPSNITVEATGKLTAVNIGTATASDEEDGNLTATPDNTGPFPLGSTTITWTATDSKGNKATDTQRITVRDTQAPTLTIPQDISVGASGILTSVNLGKATAFDQVSGNITPQPDNGGPFASGKFSVTWTATDSSGNSTRATQMVTILPRADFSIDQTVSEGKTVTVTVNLSGKAAAYPVVIPYKVTGSASNPLDHNASNGEIRINSGTTGSLSFNVVDDGASGEPASTVVFNMQSPANAVTGSRTKHTVTITESNEAPAANLLVEQQNTPVRTVYPFSGDVVVTANVSDPNSGDTHSFDWSQTDNRLVPSGGTQSKEFILSPDLLAAGIYTLRVTVTDDGIPAESVSAEIVLNVVANPPQLSSSQDQDGDGKNDASEGLADRDQDGINDYLDAISNPSVLQGEQGISDKYLLVTEPGLRLTLGATALAAGQGSANVSKSDIEKFGGNNGQPGASADDSLEYIGGIFDFIIERLTTPGQSVRIVLPQRIALRDGAIYRKYSAASGWQNYVIDANNKVASAPGSDGACPAPGSNSYRNGLQTGDYCVQLTIQDGGPNDQDGLRNAIIHDPGAAGSLPQATDNTGGGNNAAGGGGGGGGSSGGGGCSLNPSARMDPVWMLILLVAGIGIRRRRRRT